jgi:hypothetical protein
LGHAFISAGKVTFGAPGAAESFPHWYAVRVHAPRFLNNLGRSGDAGNHCRFCVLFLLGRSLMRAGENYSMNHSRVLLV